MSRARALHVRCSTWEQVDVFTTRKLRKGKLLSLKVPFEIAAGESVTLGLELPSQVVVALDGIVLRASPIASEPGAPTSAAARTWIEIELAGFTDSVIARIRAAAAPGRRTAPVVDDLPADEKALFQHLAGELRRSRGAAVHDVLGVARDADAAEIRTSWKNLVRRYHPDLVARRHAPAISHLAEELMILANRAYDRLRAALVAEGRGTIVGPTLSAPAGWLVGFDDIASGDGSVAPRAVPARLAPAPRGTPAPRTAPTLPPATIYGGEAFEERARAMLGGGQAQEAREVLAAALVVYPRSRPLRSLYYVATALIALHDREVMLAISQLENALAHHESCIEAAALLDHVKAHGAARNQDLTRIFL